MAGNSSSEDLWRALGRGSAAGRALFNLFNGAGTSRSIGNDYHRREIEAFKSRRATSHRTSCQRESYVGLCLPVRHLLYG